MKSPSHVSKTAANEVPVADYVPFGTHIAKDCIKLRANGDYIAIWKVDGIAFETTEFEELNLRKEALNNFIRTLGGGQFALWSHKVRRKVSDRLEGTFTNSFCANLNEKYFDSFNDYKMMATELYLTLVYRPNVGNKGGFFKRMAKRSVAQIQATEQQCLDAIDDVAKQVESSLNKYNPERLTTFTKKDVVYSGMASFLGFLVNGVWEDIPLRPASLSDYLPTSRLFFGDQNGMVQIKHPLGNKFAALIDFQEYPRFSETGMNNVVLYGDYEFIETQSFSMLNKRDALDNLDRQKNQLISGEEGAASEIADMDIAFDQLQSGLIEMGEYHYSLAVFGVTLNEVAKNIAEARAAFDEPGFKMANVDIVPECAWFAQLPGNWWLRPREATITSYNFVCLSPFHNFATGKRTGNPWGQALALLKTNSGQPYYLNFHASPDDQDSTDAKVAGNTTILGTTGVGKTVTVGFLLAMSDKYDARIVALDKDRGMEILIRAMGGKYRAFKRGEPTGINPFQWKDSPKTRKLCEQVVQQCTTMKGTPHTPRELEQIANVVKSCFEVLPFEMRRLGAIDQLLSDVGDNSLRLRLSRWVAGNNLGWVVDNATDTLDLHSSRKFGFDYTEFLDDEEVRPVVMLMLLHIIQDLIDGSPFIYVMEEFWKPLMDEVFSDFALNKQKTIRKENGLGVFVTQSPSDVLEHRIGKTMVEQSVTLCFLPNPRADYKDYVDGFKVTPHEFNVIKNLPEEGRMFLIKQGQRSAIVKLDLGGMNDELVVLSGSTDNVALLDDIREKVGDDPKDWMPVLLAQVNERRARTKAAKLATATAVENAEYSSASLPVQTPNVLTRNTYEKDQNFY